MILHQPSHSRFIIYCSWHLHDFIKLGLTDDGNVPDLIFEQLPFNHPLFIMYSSGTTGAPKCMVHSAGVRKIFCFCVIMEIFLWFIVLKLLYLICLNNLGIGTITNKAIRSACSVTESLYCSFINTVINISCVIMVISLHVYCIIFEWTYYSNSDTLILPWHNFTKS